MQNNHRSINNFYVVAFCSLFENTIEMDQVEADSALEAVLKYLEAEDRIPEGIIFESIEEVQEFCFNGDALIQVYAV